MYFAPVIIPTLNRINHLKRCVESLKNNPESSKTELYISVDYPPSDKYIKGYSEVIDYVNNITGFLSVNVFIQKENLGPGLNSKFLESEISKKYDRYIFSEDDNEFSTNFLAYMNWGLEKYKDDLSVFAICSCSDFDYSSDNIREDYFYIQSFNAYGTGFWCNKNSSFYSFLNKKMLSNFYNSISKQKLLYNKSLSIYVLVALDSIRRVSVMRGRDDSLTSIDIWVNFYLILNNLFCIKPIKAKSRNWGHDGSGVHKNANENINYKPSYILEKGVLWNSSPKRVNSDCESHFSDLHVTCKFLPPLN